MKTQRLNVLREVLTGNAVTSQDEQAAPEVATRDSCDPVTLSRDMHELQLFKGPRGYSLANGNGAKDRCCRGGRRPGLRRCGKCSIASACA